MFGSRSRSDVRAQDAAVADHNKTRAAQERAEAKAAEKRAAAARRPVRVESSRGDR